jgi:hypothetical protein
MNLRGVDFEGRNLTRMAHDHVESLLKFQFCCRIDSPPQRETLHLKKKLLKCYISCKVIALCGAETSACHKTDKKQLESFEMLCWRRMEKISWTDRVRNEEVLYGNKERNNLHVVKRLKADWIGHILRRNCLLKRVIEGKIERRREVKGRR